MEKNKELLPTDPNYKWWEDEDLWTEGDGEDLEDRELTEEEKEKIKELFKHKSED